MIQETARPARKGAPKPADKGQSGQPAPKLRAFTASRPAAPAVTPASALAAENPGMAENPDIELIEKVVHGLDFVVEDLRMLASAENPLLCDIALREMEVAIALSARMQRVLSLLQPEA